MSAPLPAIVAKVQGPLPVKTEAQRNAETLLQELTIIYTTVGQMTENMAARCRTYGLTALLKEIPDDADNVLAVLKGLAEVWPSFADTPFPDMPDDPVEQAVIEVVQ